MKKYTALILALLMALGCMTGCGASGGSTADDTVMMVGDSEVSWDEYMYWLGTASQELLSYYANSSDDEIDWQGSCMFDKSVTNAEWCVRRAKETALEIHSADLKAREYGVTLTDEDNADIDEQIQSYKDTYCTSDDVDAEFEGILAQAGLTLGSYRSILGLNILYYNLYTEMYGENGEKLDAGRLQQYCEENEYVASAHILFDTVATDESGAKQYDENGSFLYISEAEIAEKTAKAESVAQELQAITDDQQRHDRFIELMNELSDDPGKTSFPDGYCFTTGTMVEVYDTTSRELEEYAVSDPVTSEYGIHVIMRLPITAESLVSTSSGVATISAIAAPEFYADEAEEWTEEYEITVVPAYEKFDFTQFFDENGFNFVSFADYTSGGAKSEEPEEVLPEETEAQDPEAAG